MTEDGGRRADGPRTAAWKLFVFDVVSALAGVLLVGGLLLAVSGVWPPLVAIESGSMEPNIDTGDLVFVMEEERFPGSGAQAGTGIVTYRSGQEVGYTKFDEPGDVIVFEPDGNNQSTPIIHRAMFWVEDGERWYSKANPDYVGRYDSCQEIPTCPANYSGFITKGDNNANYDQVNGKKPVRPDWVIGTAEMRLPGLGKLRLGLEGIAGESPVERNGSATINATG